MKMRKLAVLMLSGALAFSMLTGCGGDDADYEEPVAQEEQQEPEQDVAEEPEVLEVEAYIANATEADFTEIYLSVAGNDNWDNNLLGEDEYLPSGHILPVTLQIADAEGVKWDLRVVDPYGEAIEWYGLDISEMPLDGFAIELMWDGETGTAKLAETPDQLEGNYATE